MNKKKTPRKEMSCDRSIIDDYSFIDRFTFDDGSELNVRVNCDKNGKSIQEIFQPVIDSIIEEINSGGRYKSHYFRHHE